jgi:hypothetical protein
MLIVCPNCTRSYLVRATELGQSGRLVKCGACQTSWRPDEVNSEATQINEIPIKANDFSPPFNPEELDKSKKPPFLRLIALGATTAAMIGLTVLTLNDRAGSIFNRTISWIDTFIPGKRLQGISFANIKTSIGADHGETSLIIEGEIRSDSEISKNLPEIQFTMRDEAENTIFQWMIPAPVPTIIKGEAVSFKARLASPPMDAKNITITFSGV